MVHLKLVNFLLKSKLCCQLHYQTLKVRFEVVKIFFCQNNLVQGTEITINMNCRFDSFEPGALFFFLTSHFQCPVV